MNNDKSFEVNVISSDGKTLVLTAEEAYFETSKGRVGLLKDHYPVVAKLDINMFYIVSNGERKYFTVNGGLLNFKNNICNVIANTFESREEIDKTRVLASKAKAEEAIKHKDLLDKIEFEEAEKSLKKAINRLNLLK